MNCLPMLLMNIFLFTLYSASLLAEEQHVAANDHKIPPDFFDETYHYLNTTFSQPAIWFDSFFVDDAINGNARAETKVRWYNDLSWSDLEGVDFESKLNVRVHLPRVTHKLKLIFESDDAGDPFDLFPNKPEDTENTLGLEYDVYAKSRSSFNIKVSIRPSIEARYRYSYPFNDKTSVHFTQKLYQRKKVTGESSQIDIEHSLHPHFLLRWTNFANYESDIEGFKLGSGLTLFQYISSSQAINYKASVGGLDKPHFHINNSKLSATYRQNIFKKWFFYELTPEVNWDKDIDTIHQKEATITLRLEVLFTDI